MPVDIPSIILTSQSIDENRPAEHALQAFMDSLLNFLEHQHQETAIPGKDAAVSQEADETVAGLHHFQNSTQNGESK